MTKSIFDSPLPQFFDEPPPQQYWHTFNTPKLKFTPSVFAYSLPDPPPRQYLPTRPSLLMTACLTSDRRKWVTASELNFGDILMRGGVLLVHPDELVKYENYTAGLGVRIHTTVWVERGTVVAFDDKAYR